MKKTAIEPFSGEAYAVASDPFTDHRGVFLETYRERDLKVDFVQGNMSVSKRGVTRGLHYQIKAPQGKFMRTVHGETFNVLVDMREGSPTIGRTAHRILVDPCTAIWIPPGFAAGFQALTDDAVVVYECSSYYQPGYDRAVHWLSFDIDWPFGADAILSDKDRKAPPFGTAPAVPREEWEKPDPTEGR